MTPAVLISEAQADPANTEASTAQTVRAMAAHIKESAKDPEVQRVASECWNLAQGSPYGPPKYDAANLAAAVWGWCKRNIQFVPDEVQLLELLGRTGELELLISPAVMVRTRNKRGDCDCFTMMLCSMLACLGVRPFIRTFKCDRDSPWRWSHVCAAALLEDGRVLNLDASHGSYPGWEVPAGDVYESQLWDMAGNKVKQGGGRMRGLNGYVRDRGWTGSEMTSTGTVAGPYANLDVMTAYRRRGLNAIAARKFGMGDLESDAAAMASTGGGGTVPFDAPDYQDSTGQWINGQTGLPYGGGSYGGGSSSSSGGGSIWANLAASLIGAGSKLGSQALAPAGSTILPNGTILPPGVSLASTGISSSTLLIGGLVIGGILLVSVLKK